jgi:hypothetical protein
VPTFAQITAYVEQATQVPEANSPQRTDWLDGGDALGFLRRSVVGDVPVMLAVPQFFLYAVTVPAAQLEGVANEAFVDWNADTGRTWGIVAGRDRENRDAFASLYAPSPVVGPSVFDEAEPVVFLRHFARAAGDGLYVEASQPVAQSAGLHRRVERSAYSRLDELGDYQDVIRFGAAGGGHVCTMRDEDLDQYLFATDRALVRLFQINRCADWRQWRAHQSADREETRVLDEEGLHAEHMILTGDDGPHGSTLFGAQVLREVGDRAGHIARLLGEDAESRDVASFLIPSGADGATREWPPPRGRTGPGDVEPPPHPITPAFFHPEVLSRFKRDPDKYVVTQSTIECRGAWFLRSYDVNEANQVYAYLKDLWDLPYRVQVYWQSFNEPPKAGITERSRRHDFLAQRWDGVDPLVELKQTLRRFPAPSIGGRPTPLWVVPPGDPDRALHRLHYVLVDSPDEWGSHVLELEKIVVEGLDKQPLLALARTAGLGEEVIGGLGSIKLLQRVLEAKGFDTPDVEAVCGPLYEVHGLRSHSGVGHRGGTPPEGDLRVHFRDLVGRVSEAMGRLSEMIKAGALDVPKDASA